MECLLARKVHTWLWWPPGRLAKTGGRACRRCFESSDLRWLTREVCHRDEYCILGKVHDWCHRKSTWICMTYRKCRGTRLLCARLCRIRCTRDISERRANRSFSHLLSTSIAPQMDPPSPAFVALLGNCGCSFYLFYSLVLICVVLQKSLYLVLKLIKFL